MNKKHLGTVLFLLAVSLMPNVSILAQNQKLRPVRRPRKQIPPAAEPALESQLPSDSALLDLHKEFISKAEKLAAEYENKGNLEGAREVFESLMRLLPDNVLATQGRNRVLREQSLRDKKILDIPANLNWQDTGINLIEGMPVHIEAKGEWQVINEVGPEGVIIPENLKLRGINFQLGELIGVIRTSTKDRDSKPFKIGAYKDFVCKTSGRLFLRMYDIEPSDNTGSMAVMVQSTFGR